MRNVKILYFGKFPGASPGAKRVFLYREGLREEGVDCDIIPIDDSKTGRLQRFWHTFAIPLCGFIQACKQLKYDSICFVYTSKWFCIFLAYIACRLKKSKLVLEVNEKAYAPYSDRLSELAIIKFFNRFCIEQIVYPLLDGFVVISENLKDYVLKFKSSKAEIIKIPIIIDPDVYLRTGDFPVHFERPFIIHAGSLSEKKDGVIGMLEAVALVNNGRNEKLHIYFTNSIAPADVRSRLKKIIESSLAGLVHFIGNLPDDELAVYQKNSSMLILFKPDNEQNRYNFSTKLGEFLAFARPVVFTPVGEMALYLKDHHNAIQVSDYSSLHLSEKIKYLLDRSDIARSIGLQGKQLAYADFHYRSQGKRLAQYFSHL